MNCLQLPEIVDACIGSVARHCRLSVAPERRIAVADAYQCRVS